MQDDRLNDTSYDNTGYGNTSTDYGAANADLNNTGIEGPGGTQASHAAPDTGNYGTDAGYEGDVGLGGQNQPQGMKDRAMQRARGAVDAGVSYVRERDLNEIRGDLEKEIRQSPLKSIAIALGAGYLLAKIFD